MRTEQLLKPCKIASASCLQNNGRVAYQAKALLTNSNLQLDTQTLKETLTVRATVLSAPCCVYCQRKVWCLLCF